MTRIELDGGKYTVVHDSGAGLHALRYGEHWRDMTGDGLVLAMAQEIEDLRRRIAPVQQVSVPEGLELIKRMQVCLSFDDTEWGLSAPEKYKLLGDIKSYLLAVPAAPAADAGLVEALETIINPIEAMRRELQVGEQLNGMVAMQLASDPEYLRGVAKAAIAAHRAKGVV